MMKFRCFAVAFAAILSIPVAAAVTPASEGAARALYDTLSASTNATDRALAAWMTQPKTDDDRAIRTVTLNFAAAVAPHDVLVQWLAANATIGCPHAPEETATLRAFRQLEPNNAAGGLLQLNHASACADASGISAALIEMAQAKQFDSHYGDTLQAWLTVLGREPTAQALLHANANDTTQSAGPLRIASTYATVAAEPAFDILAAACTNQAAARATACAQIGRVLAYASKTALDRSVGFALLERANAATASDNDALRELHWLMTPPTDPQARAALSRAIAGGWRNDDDELMILRNAFAAAGLQQTPPASWVDPSVHKSR